MLSPITLLRTFHVLKVETFKPIIGFLLTQEAAEGSISTGAPVVSFLFKSTAVLVKGLFICALRLISLFHFFLVGSIDLFPLDIELAQLVHIIDHMVADLDTLSCLFEGVFMFMDL